MKFRAHDTFFIRKGWLSKGMKYVQKKPDVFVAKDENPMDVLGIGANMVKALRYWLQAVGLTEEPSSGKRVQTFTSLGNSVFTNDRYIEELGTLYLLHYRLSSNKDEATAWYFFFNEFNMTEFSRDDFVGMKFFSFSLLLRSYPILTEYWKPDATEIILLIVLSPVTACLCLYNTHQHSPGM